MSESTLIVLGAGGHSKVVIATAEAAGFRIGGIYDDRLELQGSTVLGHRVVGPIESAPVEDCDGAITAVGHNATRRDFARRFPDAVWATLVHPAAFVHPSVALGAGTVVLASAVIQPDTSLGEHVVVNTAATIDHDCAVADYVHIAPGANIAGTVHLGEGCLVGVGAAVLPNLSAGAWSVVAAGATVISEIPGGSTFAGVPARSIAT